MTDEILKKIYEIRRNSKYFDEYKSVCEGTEKIYNLVWEQVLRRAFLYNERIIYVSMGYSGPLTDLREKPYSRYYKEYFKLDNNLVNNVYWFSLDEDCKKEIIFCAKTFFIMEDLKDKLEQDGFTQIEFSNYFGGVKCAMHREKLNEFIALAEEKYSQTETLRRNLQKE